MNALNNQHGVACQFQLFAVPFTFTRREIVFRNLHALTLHQPRQVVFQQVVVYSLDVVKVVVAIGQLWRVYTIHEIVVGRKRQRAQTASQQLDAQTLAERCFSR